MSTPDREHLVEIAPLTGAPGVYTYRVPPALADAARPGCRVIAPFGARKITGVVLGPTTAAPEKVRDLESVVDAEPLVIPDVLQLCRWAAEYYAAPVGLALKAALPPGAEGEESIRPILTEAGQQVAQSGGASGPTRQALLAIAEGMAKLVTPGALRRLVKDGFVELVREVEPGGEAPTIDLAVRVGPAQEEIPARHTAQRAVWSILAERERVPVEVLQARVQGARDALKRLAKRGLVRIEPVPRTDVPASAWVAGESPPPLTDDQRTAVDTLVKALEGRPERPFLLEGVTGSGKTEVYLHLIAEARARGRGALVLVPEIALTPQLAGRFRARFGAEVAVLHSGLSPGNRRSEWHRIRRGEAPIVVGARSAIFAPLENPAVIVVDEEHDASFKQGSGLRYHGRDLAVVRGRGAGSVVVLGSATPSLETVQNVLRERYAHLRLVSRVDARPLPKIELVDLRGREREKPHEGVAPSGLLSPEMLSGLRETVERGEQAIVFLNRRGHSTVVLCQDCGSACRCEQCSVAMTWHEKRGRLMCHYCGARTIPPDECATCGSVRVLYAGAGTEKLEDELTLAIPGVRLGRLDRDTATSATRVENLLAKFGRGELDVLIGTQMVAKGHDFPGVTLVCVLLADAGLHQPDFRAGERTAQLLTQVAGRAGRGTKPGRVLIQTFAPDTPAIAGIRQHDYASFARRELEDREQVGYPPFRRLCLVRVDSEQEAEASGAAARLMRALAEGSSEELEVLGPAPAPLARLQGRYRFQILVKAARPSLLGRAISRLRRAEEGVTGKVRIVCDVDPVDML